MRLDAFLGEGGAFSSRSAAAKYIEQETVYVNGVPATKRHLVCKGDIVTFLSPSVIPTALKGEYIPLDIRFEDEHLIVLSKQADLVCHPSQGHDSGTLVNALIAHCGYGNLAQLQGDDRPGIVHRLDKDTTGLMLVAKTDEAGILLQDGIRTRNIDRRYLALVDGYIAPDTGLVDAPIARDERDRTRMAVSDNPTARSSVTTFSVLERFEAGRMDNGYTLVECKLYTGRTHQIRVHMSYINHPCVGDPLYGPSGKVKTNLGLTRQFLHSYLLEFIHPLTGEELRFIDLLPPDLDAALRSRMTYSMGRTEAGDSILAQIGY